MLFYFLHLPVSHLSKSALPLRERFTLSTHRVNFARILGESANFSKSVRLASFACKRFSNIITTRIVRIKF